MLGDENAQLLFKVVAERCSVERVGAERRRDRPVDETALAYRPHRILRHQLPLGRVEELERTQLHRVRRLSITTLPQSQHKP